MAWVVDATRTITVWADPGCPWATLALYRLHRARRAAGAEDRLVFDIRAFPLELLNDQPTPRLILDAEIPVVGGLEPDIGMSLWSGRVDAYPVTTLLALEAIMAAKEQGMGLADRLDLALRLALFRDSECISLHHVICEVAGRVEGLDAAALEDALRSGRYRASVFADKEEAESTDVQGSPHLFLPDGTGIHNPGITMHKTDDFGQGGYPIVDEDEPGIYDDILERSLA
ncbi:MAG: DsbA family oxidoreductase [Actinomycetota bacterium]